MKRPRTILSLLVALPLAGCAPVDWTPRVRAGAAPAYVLHDLPEWSPVGGFAAGRHVFLKPSQQTPYGIGHELVHVRQQEGAPLWFWWSYATSPRWRLRWEAEAYAEQARAGCPVDGDEGLAAYLSGPAYLWPGTRDEARQAIVEYQRSAAHRESAAPGQPAAPEGVTAPR